jgi:HK97 family phage major capsid protein
MSLRRPGGKASGDYMKMADDLERGWGFDPVLKDILNEGAGGGGSNIIATPVEAELWRLIRDNTIVRPLATKIVMAGPSMVIPTENANVTAYLVAEGITITDSIASTAFAPQTLVAKKFAGLATVSNELFQDNIIGLQQYLFTAIAEGIGILEDRGALDGTNFTGIRVATGVNSITCALTGSSGGQVPTYRDMLGVIYGALQSASRDSGRFFMFPGTFKNVAGMVDTSGMPVFSFSNVPNAIPSFFGGYPVSLVSSLSTSYTFQTTSSNIYFGPPSKIVYGDISGMSFDLDPYSLMDKVQTRVRVLKRTGILVPVGGYFTVLNGVQWR